MKTSHSKLEIFLARITYLFLCFVPTHSLAVSQDLKVIVDQYYEEAEFEEAGRMFKEMLAENDREENDRKFILIYLSIISLLYKDTKQADDYLCQLLELEPDFDPDLSVDDITKAFKNRFYTLRAQKLCLSKKSSKNTCIGVVGAAVRKELPICQSLLEQRIITSGGQKTALSCYKATRDFCPNHPEIQKGFQEMEEFYVNWANRELDRRRYYKVQQALEGLKKVNPQSPAIADIEQRLQR